MGMGGIYELAETEYEVMKTMIILKKIQRNDYL